MQLSYAFFVDGEMCLVGLPLLLDSYCPWLAGLPLYILRLSTEVCGLFVFNLELEIMKHIQCCGTVTFVCGSCFVSDKLHQIYCKM